MNRKGFYLAESRLILSPAALARDGATQLVGEVDVCATEHGGNLVISPDWTGLSTGAAPGNLGAFLLQAHLLASGVPDAARLTSYMKVDITNGAVIPIHGGANYRVNVFWGPSVAPYGDLQSDRFPEVPLFIFLGRSAPVPLRCTFTSPSVSVAASTEGTRVQIPPFASKTRIFYSSALNSRSVNDAVNFYGRFASTVPLASFRFSAGGSSAYDQGVIIPNGAQWVAFLNGSAIAAQSVGLQFSIGEPS